MVKIKKEKNGAEIAGITPEALLIIIVADGCFRLSGEDCIVTSVTDGKHSSGSRHYSGNAVDFRLPSYATSALAIVNRMRSCFDEDYDVVIESDHIHVEYDPKEKKGGF
jgi:hypothetical protein